MARLNRTRLLAAGVAGMLGIALATPAAAATDPGWTQPGYASSRTYYNPNESVINGGSINSLEARWTVKLPATDGEICTRPSEPLVAGSRVFVTDETGVGAYQVGTGIRLWHYDWSSPDDETTPLLALAGGLLVLANDDCHSASDPEGKLVALDAATGRQKWLVNAGGPVGAMVVDKSIIAVTGSSMSSDPAVRGFRLSDGKRRWTVAGYESEGVSAKGKLLVNSEDHGIAALSITTGKKVWTRPLLMSSIAATPAGDTFYLDDGDGGLAAVKASNGATLWHVNGTGGAVAADGKRVYRGFATSVEALDARTGRRLWSTRFGAEAGQPVRAGGLLYTDVDGQGLKILTAATGQTASIWPFGVDPDARSVVVAGGRLFQVNDQTLQVYAP